MSMVEHNSEGEVRLNASNSSDTHSAELNGPPIHHEWHRRNADGGTQRWRRSQPVRERRDVFGGTINAKEEQQSALQFAFEKSIL